VVVNNDVVISETIRTKGNSASIKRAYRVPFVPNRPNDADVKVYLTETNVSGITTDLIVSTTKAKRPVINEIWLVPDGISAASVKLPLTDALNYLYFSKGLTFGTSIKYKLATKVTGSFNKVDWTGLVFGLIDPVKGTIGLIDNTGLSINSTDGSLIGISEFTFDALKFTVKLGGKLLEPVKTLDINLDLPSITMSTINFKGGNIFFGEGLEVTFTGITTPLANSISPDYFEITGTNTAKFLGKSGLYKAYFLTSANYLYIEPLPSVIYPEALWIDGTGFGRPSTPYITTANWNWNTPLDYIPCRLKAPGIYQVTMYCKNAPGKDKDGIVTKYGTLDFKFFHQRGWAENGKQELQEEWASKYTVSAPFLGPVETNGNVNVLSETVIDGVYRITLNMNDKTITAVKL
jgi:hypothetical protein